MGAVLANFAVTILRMFIGTVRVAIILAGAAAAVVFIRVGVKVVGVVVGVVFRAVKGVSPVVGVVREVVVRVTVVGDVGSAIAIGPQGIGSAARYAVSMLRRVGIRAGREFRYVVANIKKVSQVRVLVVWIAVGHVHVLPGILGWSASGLVRLGRHGERAGHK